MPGTSDPGPLLHRVIKDFDGAGRGNFQESHRTHRCRGIAIDRSQGIAAAPEAIVAIGDNSPGIHLLVFPAVLAIEESVRQSSGVHGAKATFKIQQGGRALRGQEIRPTIAGKRQQPVISRERQDSLGGGMAIEKEGIGSVGRDFNREGRRVVEDPGSILVNKNHPAAGR